MNTDKTGEPSASKRIIRAGFFWNAVYAGLNAVQSAVILFAISRKYDLTIAGVITIGFTIGNLATIVARYGLRNYQVTDVDEQFRFSDYYWSRIVSTGGTILLAFGYLLFMTASGRYATEKGLVILCVVVLKLTGAVEEVFVARLQQKGRLDIGARISACRLTASTLLIFTALWFIPNLLICLSLGIVAEILIDILMIPGGKKYTDFHVSSFDRKAVRKLLKVGIPLCVGMALHNYAGNAPKYLVDLYLTDELQAVCGYVMMPMFVLTVLNTFVMQPAVKGLGDAWHTDRTGFRKKVLRHILLISVLSVAVLGLGLTVGLPVLSAMYRVDLRSYQREFLILMAGGGLYTISAYLVVLLTTMRRQTGIVCGCIAATLVYLALGGIMSRSMGFIGACWLYIAANFAMTVVFILFLLWKRNDQNQLETPCAT